MTVLAAPNSTVSNVGFALTGGADVHECIKRTVEAPDDASYVQSTADGDSFEVTLPDPLLIDPLTQTVRIRARVRHSGIGVDNGQFFVSLRESGVDSYTSSKTEIPLAGPYDLEFDTGVIPPDLSVLSIAVLDAGTGGQRRFRVLELEGVFPTDDMSGDGGSVASSSIRGVGSVAGSGEGSSASAATPRGVGGLAGAGAGGSACFAIISAIGALAGSAAGGSSAAAVCGGVGVLVGIGAGSSQTAALPKGTGSLAGSGVGGSSAAAQPSGIGALAGMSVGSSSGSVEPPEIEALGIYQAISHLVRVRFEQLIAVPRSLPTAYDNLPFNPAPSLTWARVKVRCEDAQQIALGEGNRYRKRGAATVSIQTPLGEGVTAVHLIAVAVQDAFRRASSAHVRFTSPSIGPGYRDGADWTVDVVCPFYADVDVALGVGASLVTLPDAAAAQSTVRKRFIAAAVAAGLEIRFENDPRADPALSWAHFSIVQGESAPVESHGDGRLTYRTPAIAYALLFFAKETGEEAALGIGDQIADVFRAVTVDGVTFSTPLVRGMQRQGDWWRVDVRAPFFWHEIT